MQMTSVTCVETAYQKYHMPQFVGAVRATVLNVRQGLVLHLFEISHLAPPSSRMVTDCCR